MLPHIDQHLHNSGGIIVNASHVFKNMCPLCPWQCHVPVREWKVACVSASAIKNFPHVSGSHTNSFLGHKNTVIRTAQNRTANTHFYYINQRKNCFIKFIKDTLMQEKNSNILLPHFAVLWELIIYLKAWCCYPFREIHLWKRTLF